MDSDFALERIAAGQWEGPHRFAARQQFVKTLSRWHHASGGIPTLLGARIHPVPHQLYAAREVLADTWPRHLLADEVGLGKTIEAGLTIQALRGYHPDLRVLVAAPGAMGRQWLCEMFVRFGEQVFALIDAGRLALDEAGPLLDYGRVIVSFTALEVCPRLEQEILERDWDLVVIDEAHQVQPGSELYRFLHKLCAASKGSLGLSATPSRRDLDGLCGLLALIDPARVNQDHAVGLTEKIVRGEPLDRIVCNRREQVALQGTKLCQRKLKMLPYRVSDAEENAVAHLESHPRPSDAVQTALTGLYRQKASGSPLVILELLERRRRMLSQTHEASAGSIGTPEISLSAYPGPEEEDHIWQQVIAGASPLPGEEQWLQAAIQKVRVWMEKTVRGSARFQAVSGWIQSLLNRNNRAKVLVFAGDANLVEDFEDHLSEKIGHQRVAHIHHQRDEVTLAHEALRFQKERSCAVLISDELGGEGRNFQFASAVVHLDLPWSPARLEQRIGRLDRMGRDTGQSVLSVVPLGCGKTERALMDLHSNSFNIFNRSLGGLEFMLAPLHAKICAAFMAGPENLERLSQELASKVTEERHNSERAQAVGTPDPERLEQATRQAKSFGSADPAADRQAIRDWVQLVGGRCESLANGGTMLGWDKHKLRRPLDGVPGNRIRRMGTFQRQQALRDESLEFFAPGHPVVDAMIRDLLTSPDGRICVLQRDLGPSQNGNIFLVVTGWVGPTPDRLEPPHELVSNNKPRWSTLQQRVVQLGHAAKQVNDDGLISHITTSRSDSDRDLTPSDIEISLTDVETALKLATSERPDFHLDSIALVVGAD
jgi:superfamily II DNA or RNA helicase